MSIRGSSLLLALTAGAAVGGTYTITNGACAVVGPIKTVLQRLGIHANLRRLPYLVVYALAGLMELRATLFGGEPLLTRYTAAILAKTQTYNIEAAGRDLGYAPLVSIPEGVERTLAELEKPNARKGRDETDEVTRVTVP